MTATTKNFRWNDEHANFFAANLDTAIPELIASFRSTFGRWTEAVVSDNAIKNARYHDRKRIVGALADQCKRMLAIEVGD